MHTANGQKSVTSTRRNIALSTAKALTIATMLPFCEQASAAELLVPVGIARDRHSTVPPTAKVAYKEDQMHHRTMPYVLDTTHFVATPCIDCDIPGYLVLQPKEVRGNIHELSSSSQEQLGSVLGRLEVAVRAASFAEHVYLLRFSEGLSSVHFHIFPRTKQVADLWMESNPTSAHQGINGPLLFAWARLKYYVDSPEKLSLETRSTAIKITSLLSAGSE